MKFAHIRAANISHLRSKYFTAKRFHLPEWANFVVSVLENCVYARSAGLFFAIATAGCYYDKGIVFVNVDADAFGKMANVTLFIDG